MEKYQILKSQLLQLKLRNTALNFYQKAQECRNANVDYLDFLSEIISDEINDKLQRSINYRIRTAKYPMFKTIENFDFDFQPEFEKEKLMQLLEFKFLKDNENIIFIGPPGVGKTHLSIALGIEASKSRIRNIFYTANDLIKQLRIAKVSNTLPELLEKLNRYDIVIVDELGYMPLSADDANLFFQFVNKKYERSSIVISSNSNFSDWGKIFKDEVVAAAIIDRLIHHCHIFKINGDSYRAKNKKIDVL